MQSLVPACSNISKLIFNNDQALLLHLQNYDYLQTDLNSKYIYVVNAIQLLENSRYNYLPRVKLVVMSSYMAYHHTVINYTNTILLMFFGSKLHNTDNISSNQVHGLPSLGQRKEKTWAQKE